jgi:RimJ/RimL family protein N-acetyltransferase
MTHSTGFGTVEQRNGDRVVPLPSARLAFRSRTDKDTALAGALWWDPEVTHYFGGAMTSQQAQDRLRAERERESRLDRQYWPMFLRETGEFAGCAGLRPWSMNTNTIEAGVHLMRSAWGLRLGEEAFRALLAHGFDTLGLPVIVAGPGIGHDNSQKLLERVGFSYTICLRTWSNLSISETASPRASVRSSVHCRATCAIVWRSTRAATG